MDLEPTMDELAERVRAGTMTREAFKAELIRRYKADPYIGLLGDALARASGNYKAAP